MQSEISATIALVTIVAISTVNPISMATCLMISSILMTSYLHNTLTSSWLPLILILTFSSGIITLFIYTASLASNESNNAKNNLYPLLMLFILPPTLPQKNTQLSINAFSSYSSIIVLAAILVVTLLALTAQAHNPNQTLSSSF